MTTSAFNKCVDGLADNLYRFVLKNIRQEDKAMDIVQDTFEKAWRKVDRIEADKAKAYLFRTAYTTMLDQIRKDKFETELEVVKDDPATKGAQYSDLSEILEQAIQKLPDIQRSVIMLRDYEGYSYEEIGEVTGLNESQVKVYIYRGRKKLQQYIGSIEAVI